MITLFTLQDNCFNCCKENASQYHPVSRKVPPNIEEIYSVECLAGTVSECIFK